MGEVYDYKLPEPITDDELSHYRNLDAWTLIEAIFLIHGCKPRDDMYTHQELSGHFQEAYSLAKAGILFGALAREITMAGERRFIDTPAHWITWARGKELPVDERLLPGNKKTRRAIIKKQDNKAIRRKAMREFADTIYQHGDMKSLPWASQNKAIPCTKDHFLDCFWKKHQKELTKVAPATAYDDLKVLGIKFRSGRTATNREVLDLESLLQG